MFRRNGCCLEFISPKKAAVVLQKLKTQNKSKELIINSNKLKKKIWSENEAEARKKLLKNGGDANNYEHQQQKQQLRKKHSLKETQKTTFRRLRN